MIYCIKHPCKRMFTRVFRSLWPAGPCRRRAGFGFFCLAFPRRFLPHQKPGLFPPRSAGGGPVSCCLYRVLSKNARSANGEAVKSTVLICRLPFDGVSVNGGLCLSSPALWAGLGVGKVTKCYRKRPVFDAPRIASKKNASFAIQQLQTRYLLLSRVYGISVKPSR